jgi:hypothetical protein
VALSWLMYGPLYGVVFYQSTPPITPPNSNVLLVWVKITQLNQSHTKTQESFVHKATLWWEQAFEGQPQQAHLTGPLSLSFIIPSLGLVAQSVEQRIENVGERINSPLPY